ncbi:MAG: choice-of-anchor D domain-containing protein [bacterium]
MRTYRSIVFRAIVFGLILLFTGYATAQDYDVLGIYFDPDATVNEITAPTGAIVQAYLCLLNISGQRGVSGWECAVSNTPGYDVLVWDIQGDHINVMTPPEFAVGMSTPHYYSSIIVLLEMTVQVTATGTGEFYLHPVNPPSLPGQMVYAPYGDPGCLVPMNWSSGGEEFPVATIESYYSPPICSLEPAALDFGHVYVDDWREMSFTITNSGGDLLSGVVPEVCGDFTVVAGSGPFSLLYDQTREVTVRFAPLTPGDHSCALDLGSEFCEVVQCSGNATIAPAPVCNIDLTTLDFGEVRINDHNSLVFTISNDGEVGFQGSVPATCTAQFSVTSGAGFFLLEPGQQRQVVVRFAPTALGEFHCDLDLGHEACSSVHLQGLGLQRPAECHIYPASLSFGNVPINSEAFRSVTVTNGGAGNLFLEVSSPCDSNFAFTAWPDTVTLQCGESRHYSVRFTPTEEGEFECYLNFGSEFCDELRCSGFGVLPPPCEITPSPLQFGDVIIGATTERTLTITNTGLETLTGTVPILCNDFTVVMGMGPFSLLVGESLEVLIQFSPTEIGQRLCVLDIEGLCDEVQLIGNGLEPQPECQLSVSSLDFGGVVVNSHAYRSFTITNIGADPLVGLVAEACDHFDAVAGAGPFTLATGEIHEVTVEFAPPSAGSFDCTVTLGTESCADMLCFGEGVTLSPDQDILGIYEDELASNYIWEVYPYMPFSAYLCIVNATEFSGVAGWECLVEWTEPLNILSWNVRGQFINVNTPPAFTVGLSSPLPWQPSIVLMEILAMIVTDISITSAFYLHPVPGGGMPNQMVYAAGDDPGRVVPLNWPTGGEAFPVALIMIDSPLMVELDPPRITASAAGLLLSWPCRTGEQNEYRLYRRTENTSFEEVVGSEVTEQGDRATCIDQVAEMSAGTLLFYRYEVIEDGIVTGRSNESRIALAARGPRNSVLHANYPNPFNPQTTIAFELAQPQVVHMQVFDISGRLVRVLLNGESTGTGRREVVWNGRDETGRPVASGTYYYRLTAGAFTETKRMVLVR